MHTSEEPFLQRNSKGRRSFYIIVGDDISMIGELGVKTYGMEEAISAMERATNATKQQGINHPKTNPTWPPIQEF